MDFDNVIKIVNKMIDPLRRRISLMVGRAVLSAAVNDSTTFQTIQLDALSDETLNGLERFQNYGFTSVPEEGAEAIVVFPQGNRDHGVIIACDDRRYRKKGMKPGETAMYGKLSGARFVIIEEDGKITIQTDAEVNIVSPSVNLGPTAAESVIKGETFQALFNAHTHISNFPGFLSGPPTAPLTGLELSLVTKTD